MYIFSYEVYNIMTDSNTFFMVEYLDDHIEIQIY